MHRDRQRVSCENPARESRRRHTVAYSVAGASLYVPRVRLLGTCLGGKRPLHEAAAEANCFVVA